MSAFTQPYWARILRVLALALLLGSSASVGADLVVGSKRFTESYILAEIIAQTAREAGEARVVVRPGLGNTAVVFSALKSGSIDIYPEYTGTIVHELLQGQSGPSLDAINSVLKTYGVAAAVPLGFSNSYALALADAKAQVLRIQTVSDLARNPDLSLGLSQEFLNRKDGWPALKTAYALPFAPRGLDHGLAYEALASGRVDVIDIYSTDAKIVRYGLRVLTDDRRFFPEYAAVLLYRVDLPQRLPKTWASLTALEGKIPPARMIALNAAAELDSKPFAQIAAEFRGAKEATDPRQRTFMSVLFAPDFWPLTVQHLVLVFASLAIAVVVGIPLGIWAARSAAARHVVFPVVGMLQTIPALALLAFLIALFDRIGTVPALVALFLYALLPIVRNTATGLAELPRGIKQAGSALGLRPSEILRLIELPLASRTILAGIKTSAVINVGTATIAAFIGAGGYGDRIVAGLAVNDNMTLLAGAIPAAVLALVTQGLFDIGERCLVPAGLRLKDAGK